MFTLSLLNQITHTKHLLTVTVNKKDPSKKIGIFLSPEKLKILKYLSQTTGLMMPKWMILKMLNLKVGMIFQNKLMTQKLRNQKIGMMKPMVNGSLQFDNPEYKGEWKAKRIDNPDFVEDDELYMYESFGLVGIDIWQVKAGSIFDNIFLGDSLEEAQEFMKETYTKNKDAEKKMFDKAEEERRAKEEEERKKEEEERKAREAEEEEDEEDEDEDEEEEEEATPEKEEL